ncbi:hypothetical protein K0817_005590 [Microbacterium sp. HD4P20]|nr:hypothetical protein [Microbacterium sp. HD4P20]MCP2636041.1 hypothetical protein [Microbacterium sp. HD4P20]
MASLDDDQHAVGVGLLPQLVRDLVGETFLQLQSGTRAADESGYVAETKQDIARLIGDVYQARERQKMVFADGHEVDVPDEDDSIAGLGVIREWPDGGVAAGVEVSP